MNEVTFDGQVPVDGYGPGFFRLGGAVHEGPVLLAPGTGPVVWAGLDETAPLLALAGQIDVLFIGLGAEIAALPPGLGAEFEAASIGVESMATPPACRTYNVLLSEGRRIAAALLPV